MNNNTFVHKYLKTLVAKDDLCVDMTLGNGNDALFLASLSKRVVGFDISEEAIRNSKEKLKAHPEVLLIKDNHINVGKYLTEKARLFIFNLGYLPRSNQKTITKASETLIAFRKAYELTADDGYLIITFYTGHPGGKDEYYLLSSYFENNGIYIQERYRQDKPGSPITFIIRKSIENGGI